MMDAHRKPKLWVPPLVVSLSYLPALVSFIFLFLYPGPYYNIYWPFDLAMMIIPAILIICFIYIIIASDRLIQGIALTVIIIAAISMVITIIVFVQIYPVPPASPPALLNL